jgi:6-phosphofructokinase
MVVGGDGSLTGALALDAFLRQQGAAFTELEGMSLQIVGLPGSARGGLL